MTWSLNEIEALSRKAARGAGLSWGLAEEAGKAARWLVAQGLPGPQVLADLLTRNDGTTYETLCPHDEDEGRWTARGGTLCPLISGAALCDHASRLAAGEALHLGRTASPMLLLPYLDAAARMAGRSVTVSWEGVSVTCGAADDIPDGMTDALSTTMVDAVSILPGALCDTETPSPTARADIPEATARQLDAFAQRTYAPETETSRLAGAGAGLTDND
ncbi:hypothetical protein RAZWK3B_19741 [Roseobacter sp. AzwK-3b]|uniref:DUF3726 domain-containing protein n=1 Tax=Roseobacter sp. AzwK-3b TaxID=351016 RepID=UPI0001569220|nr:DUF3726 domain-containing protein [Roseobacter sp. AzwK-3b]EDM71619.1 hypothetical protein RAZWK3B_19741 [Roseobacter sp. AzwK-3b]